MSAQRIVLIATVLFACSSGAAQTLKAVEQTEDHNLQRNGDFYLISGKPDTKVRLGFKVRVLENEEFYLSYAQMMFWQLGEKDSNPFRDVNFNPQWYYRFHFIDPLVDHLDLGVEHMSNGKDGLESRSVDSFYAQISLKLSLKQTAFEAAVKLFSIYDLDKTNKDMRRYRGISEVQLTAKGLFDHYFPGKIEAYVRFFPGGELQHATLRGGFEAGAKVRIRMFGILPALFFQTYQGYGESLADYNKSVETYRAGIAI